MGDKRTAQILREGRARQLEIGDAIEMHLSILQARARVEPDDTAWETVDEQGRHLLALGMPVLDARDVELDWTEVVRLAGEICEIAAKYQPAHADAFAALAQSIRDNPTRVRKLAREYLLASEHPYLSGSPSTFPNLHAFVLNNALHPFLSHWARQVDALIRSATWKRAYCPVCGGVADFAALEKESGARRLFCSRCDCEWLFDRSGCSFCGVDQHMGYFPVGVGGYRLYVCDNCKHYLKTIDLREMAREVDLTAERVLTLGLDVAAVNAGYSNGSA